MEVALYGRTKSPHAEVRGRRRSLEARNGGRALHGQGCVLRGSLRSHLRMRAWEGGQEWTLLYMGASNLLMLRCEAEGRASKHAPAVRRCIGRVASFEARVRSHLRMRAWEGAQEWRLLYMGASNLLMLRCAAEGRASKHAPAAGRCIGKVASFEARVRSHLRMRAWEGGPDERISGLDSSPFVRG